MKIPYPKKNYLYQDYIEIKMLVLNYKIAIHKIRPTARVDSIKLKIKIKVKHLPHSGHG